MTCHDLALCIERMQPETQPRDVARLCFLLSNSVEDLELLEDEERLAELWQGHSSSARLDYRSTRSHGRRSGRLISC